MLIQIYGADFRNRGAQLMLWTVADALRRREPKVELCVEPYGSTFVERSSYELKSLAPPVLPSWTRKFNYAWPAASIGSRLIPKGLAGAYGVSRRHDVDGFIDISGYAYGDLWPFDYWRQIVPRVERVRRSERPVVFLPQMWGPLTQPKSRQAVGKIIDSANLLYARDSTSLACLKELRPDAANIQLAPDITIFSGAESAESEVGEPYACLVPNVRMLDKQDEFKSAGYVDLMRRLGERAAGHGLKVFVLVHDGSGADAPLAARIVRELSLDDSHLVVKSDPLEIKAFISRAQLLIGSRYHSLIAAVSTGIPAIALGWSHKYETLMADFGVPELSVLGAEHERAVELVDRLCQPSEHAIVRERLKNAKSQMNGVNQAMWEKVFQTLGL